MFSGASSHWVLDTARLIHLWRLEETKGLGAIDNHSKKKRSNLKVHLCSIYYSKINSIIYFIYLNMYHSKSMSSMHR